MNNNDEQIITYLKENIKNKSDKIMELGFGNGNYSSVLRRSFPDEYIIGYDRNERFRRKESPDELNLNEQRFTDISDETDKEKFNIVSFGSSRIPVWFHFNMKSEEELINLIKVLSDKVLKSGKLIITVKTYPNKIQSEINYTDYLQFTLNSGELITDNSFFNNVDMDLFIKEELLKTGFKNISITEFKDKEELSIPVNPCKMYLEYKKLEYNKYAENLDSKIMESGMDKGYFSIIIAEF